jgi:LPXTG-site transpeptidase (sortase) family protein
VALLSFGVYTIADSEDSNKPTNVVDLEGEKADELLSLPSPRPTDAPVPTPGPTPVPPLGDAAYTMTIDRIGVNAPVKTFGLDKKAVPEVPVGEEGRVVVAWYNFSARPGTGSNAVFAGHVTWNGQAVFYNLNDLEAGDTIRLTSPDGTEVVYSVSSKFSVDPEDPDSLKVMYATDKDVITIITCGGDFTRTGDPVFGGEYNERLVVRADLVSVNQPAAARVAN